MCCFVKRNAAYEVDRHAGLGFRGVVVVLVVVVVVVLCWWWSIPVDHRLRAAAFDL